MNKMMNNLYNKSDKPMAQQNAVIKCLDKSGIPFTEFFSLFGCSDVTEL